MELECYNCGRSVDVESATQVADELDSAHEEVQELLQETSLDVVHCMPTERQALADGRVVYCRPCWADGLTEVIDFLEVRDAKVHEGSDCGTCEVIRSAMNLQPGEILQDG